MNLRETVVRQFNAPLKMMETAITLCPEQLWLEGDPNRFWHIAYHALFYTHLYLAPTEAEVVPWEKRRPDYHFLGAPPGRAEVARAEVPYTQAELLEYVALCRGEVETQIAVVDFEAVSGFFWLPFDKLELQFYNIRHLQHHVGQLAERLRTHAGVGLPWAR